MNIPPTSNKRKKGNMSAVRRWIMRGTSTINPTPPSPPPTIETSTSKCQRGRSQSLDVQSLERSGVKALLMNVIYNLIIFIFWVVKFDSSDYA